MNKFIYLFLCTVVIISCAQPATPTGGKKDETPPILTATSIPNHSTSLKPKIITFYFDENIHLKNQNNNITITPNITPIPTIQKTNKSISIRFLSDSLQSNTTYTISLNDAITDLNEGNIGSYHPYIFSTGSRIDTQQININATNIFPDKKNNIKVKVKDFLQPNLNYNITLNNNKGTIFGIKNTPYEIIVYNDANGNNMPDSTENQGYKIVDETNDDTLSILLYPKNKNTITVFENNKIEYIYGIAQENIPQIKNQYLINSIKDTLFGDPTTIDSLIKSLPSEKYIKPTTHNKIENYFSYNLSAAAPAPNALSLDFNSAITVVTKDSIICLDNDNNPIPQDSFVINISKNTLNIKTNTPNPTFIIHPLAITFKNSSTNPFLKINMPKYCPITFNNNTQTDIVGIMSSNNTSTPIFIKTNQNKTMYVPCGTYNAVLYSDIDNNGYLTGPDPLKHTNGEKVILLQNIATNPTLHNEIILKFSE